MNTPRAGQYLFSSCAGDDYGQITKVGEDGNGAPTIDIELYNITDALWIDEEDPDFPFPLTTVALMPEADVYLLNVQYKMLDDKTIHCHTPGNGCFRCTKLFTLNDEPTLR